MVHIFAFQDYVDVVDQRPASIAEDWIVNIIIKL